MYGTVAAIKKVIDVFTDQDGTRYFRIVWKDTWEPELHLISCQDALDEFWKHRIRQSDVSVELEKTNDFACQTEGKEESEHIVPDSNCIGSMASHTIQCSLVNTTSVNFESTSEVRESPNKTLKMEPPIIGRYQDFKDSAVQCSIQTQPIMVDAVVQSEASQQGTRESSCSLDGEISFCDVECQSEQESKDYALQHNPEVKGIGLQWYPQTRSRGAQVRRCCQSQANVHEHIQETVKSLMSTATQYDKNMSPLLIETGTQCDIQFCVNNKNYCSGTMTTSLDNFQNNQNNTPNKAKILNESVSVERMNDVSVMSKPLHTGSPCSVSDTSVVDGISQSSTHKVSPIAESFVLPSEHLSAGAVENPTNSKQIEVTKGMVPAQNLATSTQQCFNNNYLVRWPPLVGHQALALSESNYPLVEHGDDNTIAPNAYSVDMSEFLKKQLLEKLGNPDCNYKEMLFLTENPINSMCLQDRVEKGNKNPARCVTNARKRPISNRRGSKRRRVNSEIADVKVKINGTLGENLSRSEFLKLNRMTYSSKSNCMTDINSQPIVSSNQNGIKINAVPMIFLDSKRENQCFIQNGVPKATATVQRGKHSPEFINEHDEELSLDESVASTVYDPKSPIGNIKAAVGYIKSKVVPTKYDPRAEQTSLKPSSLSTFTDTGQMRYSIQNENATGPSVLVSTITRTEPIRPKFLEEKNINEDFISRYWSPS